MRLSRDGNKGRKRRLLRPPRQIPKEGLSPFKRLAAGLTYPFLKGLLGVAVAVCVVLISALGPRENLLKYRPGDVATETVYATTDFELVDEEQTLLLRSSEEARVPPMYDFEDEVGPSVLANLRQICESASGNAQSTPTLMIPGLTVEQCDGVCKVLPKMIEKVLRTPIRAKTGGPVSIDKKLVIRGLQEGKEVVLSESDVKSSEEAVSEIMVLLSSKGLPTDEASLAAVRAFVDQFVRPTLVYNSYVTLSRKQKAAAAVLPVVTGISRGECIVRQGERLDEKTLMTWKELKRLEAEREFLQGLELIRIQDLLGRSVLMGMLLILAWMAARKEPAANAYPLSKVAIMGLAVVIVAGLIKVGLAFWDARTQLFLCVCAVCLLSLVFSALHGWLAASGLTFLLSGIMGLMMRDQLEIAVVAGVAGLYGAMCMVGTTRRIDLFKVGAVMAASAACVSFGASLWAHKDALSALKDASYGSVGALSAMALTPVALWAFESLFGSSSDIRLLELSDLRQPVLRRLDREAPGTYEHSLLVANLAEVGAFSVGANPLRAKVGGLYHDIGKMGKADYFVENQPQGRSKHSKLAPSMSALILTSHVKEGVQMAQEAKLPVEIVDIIREHHGTSKIAFFYEKAKSQDANTREGDYRYGGPKPRSREAAIVMLADSVEAASRSLDTRSASRVRKMVKSVIDGKFEDGQLDECPLALKDVTAVTEVFSRVLTAFYHARIEYPDESAKPTTGTNASGTGHPEPTA